MALNSSKVCNAARICLLKIRNVGRAVILSEIDLSRDRYIPIAGIIVWNIKKKNKKTYTSKLLNIYKYILSLSPLFLFLSSCRDDATNMCC